MVSGGVTNTFSFAMKEDIEFHKIWGGDTGGNLATAYKRYRGDATNYVIPRQCLFF